MTTYQIKLLITLSASLVLSATTQGYASSLPLTPPTQKTSEVSKFRPNMHQINLPAVQIDAAQPTELHVSFLLQEGFHLNAHAPSNYEVFLDGEKYSDGTLRESTLVVPIERLPEKSKSVLTFLSTIYFCKEVGSSVCEIKSYEVAIPLTKTQTPGNVKNIVDVKIDTTM